MRRRIAAAALAWAPIALLGVLAPAAVSWARPEKPYRILAGARVKPDRDHPSPSGTTLARTVLEGVEVSVEYVDTAGRAAYMRAALPGGRDPFATPSGHPERYLTFLVRFDNRSTEELVFHPGNVALVSDKRESSFPVDMTDLYLGAERAGVADLQQVIDRSTRILFDASTVVPGGASMERLLAFRPIDGRWKQFQVHFSFLQIGAETHTLTFTFHKQTLPD